MKQLFSLCFLLNLFLASAQTNMFTGAIDDNWHNGNNWGLGLVPTGAHNVIIGPGTNAVASSAVLANSIALSDTSSLTLSSNLDCNTHIMIPQGAIFNWMSGYISAATLTNQGIMNLVPWGGKQLINQSVLNNEGTILITTDWTLDIANATVNNLATGVIDLNGVQAGIAASTDGLHILNNAGLIKKTGSTSGAQINAELRNTGTIQVETGSLELQNPSITLTNSTLNVFQGANLQLMQTVTVNGTTTGEVNGWLNWIGTLNVPETASVEFSGSGVFNWGNGVLTGGGILDNLGELSLTPAYFGGKSIQGGTTLRNHDLIEVSTDWGLVLMDGTLDNLASGTIDFTSPHSLIKDESDGLHDFLNAGTVKKSAGGGAVIISADLVNSGTIEASAGLLSLDAEPAVLNGGTYNALGSGLLDFTGTQVVSGTLTGSTSGMIRWWGTVSVPASATFNFTENAGIHWLSGDLTGGGTLTNSGILTQTAGGIKQITGDTTLWNNGTFNFTSDSGMTIDDGVIVNNTEAVIDLQTAMIVQGTNEPLIDNRGLFKKSGSTGTADFQVEIHNSGVIEASAGMLQFYHLLNEENGVVTGTASVSFPLTAIFENNGTFAPGGNPGVLTAFGMYKSTENAVLDLELMGLAQDMEYDRLQVNGGANFSGSVHVNLGFAPEVGDEFTVATVSGSIGECALEGTTSALFDGLTYTFSVECRDNNKVVLALETIALGLDDTAFSDGLRIAPNPASGATCLLNQSGKTIDRVEILDLSGRLVKAGTASDEVETKLDLSGLAAGTYLVRIGSENEVVIRKISVK